MIPAQPSILVDSADAVSMAFAPAGSRREPPLVTELAAPAAGLRPHWWQWPTMASLDAPAVALVWQALVARTAGMDWAWPQAFVLGASVWLAYAADRWFEGWRLSPAQTLTQRHRFYQRFRWPVLVVWLLVLGFDVGVAVRWLSSRDLLAGLLLLLPVAGYLLSHQLLHRHSRWRPPKELCVAALLSGGVSLFVADAPGVHAVVLVLPVAGFATLCFINCALISVWEQPIDRVHGQTSLARQFRHGAVLAHLLPWGVAGCFLIAVVGLPGPLRSVALCALTSSILLGLIDRLEPRVGWALARVLADAALLTPLWPLLAGHAA